MCRARRIAFQWSAGWKAAPDEALKADVLGESTAAFVRPADQGQAFRYGPTGLRINHRIHAALLAKAKETHCTMDEQPPSAQP